MDLYDTLRIADPLHIRSSGHSGWPGNCLLKTHSPSALKTAHSGSREGEAASERYPSSISQASRSRAVAEGGGSAAEARSRAFGVHLRRRVDRAHGSGAGLLRRGERDPPAGLQLSGLDYTTRATRRATGRIREATHPLGAATRGSRVPTRGSSCATRGSRRPTFGSSCATRGSRVLTLGSRVPTFGSRVLTRGSSVLTRGSRVPTRGSSCATLGSSVLTPGSSVPTLGLDGRWIKSRDPAAKLRDP